MTNKNLFQLLVGFFTVVLLVTSCTSKDGLDTEADTAAINAIWSSYVSSLEAGDIDAWLSLWTEDGVQMPPNEAPVIGKDKLRQRNEAAFEIRSNPKDSFSPIRSYSIFFIQDKVLRLTVEIATQSRHEFGCPILA